MLYKVWKFVLVPSARNVYEKYEGRKEIFRILSDAVGE